MSAELKPLPCPFCGHVGLDFAEGSTFRWIVASCGGCGATTGETRIQTLGQGTKDEWMATAQVDAIVEWNRRTPSAPGAPQEAAPELLRGWKRYEKARKLSPFEWNRLHIRNLSGETFDDMIDALPEPSTPVPEAVKDSLPTQAAAVPDPWHTAVLAECMLTEACYQEANPAATVKALIDWHVANAAAVPAVGRDAKDAARYRWLRSHTSVAHWNRLGHYGDVELDAQIDASLAGGDGEGG